MIEANQVRNSHRAGTEKELMRSLWGSAAYWLAHMVCSACFILEHRHSSPWDGTTHNDPHSPITVKFSKKKKKPDIATYFKSMTN